MSIRVRETKGLYEVDTVDDLRQLEQLLDLKI